MRTAGPPASHPCSDSHTDPLSDHPLDGPCRATGQGMPKPNVPEVGAVLAQAKRICAVVLEARLGVTLGFQAVGT